MNTKLQLLILVIAVFFGLSSSFTINSRITNETRTSKEVGKPVNTNLGDNAATANDKESQNSQVFMVPISHGDAGLSGLHTDDDGLTHRFHFERVRKVKKCVGILCLVVKAILIVTHAALLICGFIHALHP
jgi:hypothetical protein